MGDISRVSSTNFYGKYAKMSLQKEFYVIELTDHTCTNYVDHYVCVPGSWLTFYRRDVALVEFPKDRVIENKETANKKRHFIAYVKHGADTYRDGHIYIQKMMKLRTHFPITCEQDVPISFKVMPSTSGLQSNNRAQNDDSTNNPESSSSRALSEQIQSGDPKTMVCRNEDEIKTIHSTHNYKHKKFSIKQSHKTLSPVNIANDLNAVSIKSDSMQKMSQDLRDLLQNNQGNVDKNFLLLLKNLYLESAQVKMILGNVLDDCKEMAGITETLENLNIHEEDAAMELENAKLKEVPKNCGKTRMLTLSQFLELDEVSLEILIEGKEKKKKSQKNRTRSEMEVERNDEDEDDEPLSINHGNAHKFPLAQNTEFEEIREKIDKVINRKRKSQESNSSNDGPDNRGDANEEPPKKNRGIARTFSLPEEYNPHDSRWTLRYQKKEKGLVELTPHSGVYVDKVKLGHCKRIAQDKKTLARMLVVEIYNDAALRTCSLTGQKANAFDPEGLFTRPGLDQRARTVLMNYVERQAHKNNWVKISDESVSCSIRNKLQEMRRKWHKKENNK